MTRIRYKKVSENVYRSTKPILIGQNMVTIEINVEKQSLRIYDGNDKIYHVTGIPFDKARKTARKYLIAMGAQFETKIKKVI